MLCAMAANQYKPAGCQRPACHCLLLRWDGHRNGTLPSEYMNNRALRGEAFAGGTVVVLVNMLELKKSLLTDAWKCHGYYSHEQ